LEEKIGRIRVPGKKKVIVTIISINKPGIVAHTCDPSYGGGYIYEEHGPRCPEEKCETLPRKKKKTQAKKVWGLCSSGHLAI
jgi:hypothetical protein